MFLCWSVVHREGPHIEILDVLASFGGVFDGISHVSTEDVASDASFPEAWDEEFGCIFDGYSIGGSVIGKEGGAGSDFFEGFCEPGLDSFRFETSGEHGSFFLFCEHV